MARLTRSLASLLLPSVMLLATWGPAPAAQAQDIRAVDEGPVHEAFLTPVTGVVALDPVPVAPPPEITERIPARCDRDAEWIKGYWAWVAARKDFLWVGGCWRKRPPGRHWINGYWLEVEGAFVRVRGFWADTAEPELAYIDIAPPDPIEEEVPPSPGPGYFWFSGYWHFVAERHDFDWLGGHWVAMDPNWVCSPGHYTWSRHGYVFVPPFWDFPIEKRGCTYSCVYIEPALRATCVYEPVVIVEPEIVVRRCFLDYPDYIYFYHHHHHFHGGFWLEFGEAPTWWGWDSWWTLSWHSHWGAWFWYTHPGYAHPVWITAYHASLIHPPSTTLILAAKVSKPPSIVTPHGVIAPSKTLEPAAKAKPGPGKPVAPPVALKPDPKAVAKLSPPTKSTVEPLLPSGKKEPGKPSTAKAADVKPEPPKPIVTKASKPSPPLVKSGEPPAKGSDKSKPSAEMKSPTTKPGATPTPKTTAPTTTAPTTKPSSPPPPVTPKTPPAEKSKSTPEPKTPTTKPSAPPLEPKSKSEEKPKSTAEPKTPTTKPSPPPGPPAEAKPKTPEKSKGAGETKERDPKEKAKESDRPKEKGKDKP